MPKTKKYNKKTNKKRINKRKTIKKGGAETTKWLQLNSYIINKSNEKNEENVLYSIDYNPIVDTNEQEPFVYLNNGKNLISYFEVNNLIFNSQNINNEKQTLLNNLNENIKTKNIVIKFSNENINIGEMDNQYELSHNGECEDYVCKLYDYGNTVSMKDTLSSIKKKSLYERIRNKKIQNPLTKYSKYILIENCGQDLFDYINKIFKNKKNRKITSHDIETLIQQLYIVKDMLLGLQCIHKARYDTNSQGELEVTNSYYYIHGDIKLENIVINNLNTRDKFKSNIIKFIDFGHSEKVYSHSGPQRNKLGTEMYNAPEHYNKGEDRGKHSKASDIWSLGFTILILLFYTDYYQQKGKNNDFLFLIQRDYYYPKYKSEEDLKKKLHDNLFKLLNNIIQSFYNYYFYNFKSERQSINKELEDRFVENLGNFFYYLLHYDPEKRDLDKAIIEFDQLFNTIIDKYHNDIDVPPLQNFNNNPLEKINPFKLFI